MSSTVLFTTLSQNPVSMRAELFAAPPSAATNLFHHIHSFLDPERTIHAIALTNKHMVAHVPSSFEQAKLQEDRKRERERTREIKKIIEFVETYANTTGNRNLLLDKFANSQKFKHLEESFHAFSTKDLITLYQLFLNSREFPLLQTKIIDCLEEDHFEKRAEKLLEDYSKNKTLFSLKEYVDFVQFLNSTEDEETQQRSREETTNILLAIIGEHSENNEVEQAIAVSHLIPIEDDRKFALQWIAAQSPN